jgi:hypothetical protein
MARSLDQTALPSTLAALLCVCVAASGVEPMAPAQFEGLHTLIKPKTTEQTWERVPWLTSLWEARQKAAAHGKPILLWEMDGHPLGCT